MLAFDRDGWLFSNPLDNLVHDIDIVDINDLLILASEDDIWASNVRDVVKQQHDRSKNSKIIDWAVEDTMIRNTGGTVVSMPFGRDIITFNSKRHFYRGENKQYTQSVSSLRRKQVGKSKYESELIKAIAVMRSIQFAKFICKIDIVPYWEAKLSDINFDALAQHYGFDTCLLDLTNDFRTALFFATCKYDYKTDSYRPLNKKDIAVSESSEYGVIFHSPNWILDDLNFACLERYMRYGIYGQNETCSFYSGKLDGVAFQIGYQPLMRCHHQSGYVMPMVNAVPLQEDKRFEKIRFKQSESLSNQVYEMMDKGKKIFPYEGINKGLEVLRLIQKSITFSENDLSCAYDYGAINKDIFSTLDDFRNAVKNYQIDGHIIMVQENEIDYPISEHTLQEINSYYNGRNLLDIVGNMIYIRPEQKRYREQRCIDIYGELI